MNRCSRINTMILINFTEKYLHNQKVEYRFVYCLRKAVYSIQPSTEFRAQHPIKYY